MRQKTWHREKGKSSKGAAAVNDSVLLEMKLCVLAAPVVKCGVPSVSQKAQSQLRCTMALQGILNAHVSVGGSTRSRTKVSQCPITCACTKLQVRGYKRNTYADSNEILEGLGHFQALDSQVPRVQEEVAPALAAIVGLQERERESRKMQNSVSTIMAHCRAMKASHKKKVPRPDLGLGDFVIMVGKAQIHTTSVNVNAVLKYRITHGRALNVPPRAPLPEFGVFDAQV